MTIKTKYDIDKEVWFRKGYLVVFNDKGCRVKSVVVERKEENE